MRNVFFVTYTSIHTWLGREWSREECGCRAKSVSCCGIAILTDFGSFGKLFLLVLCQERRYRQNPCGAGCESKECKSDENQQFLGTCGFYGHCGRSDYGVYRCCFLHLCLSALYVLGCLVIQVECQSRFVCKALLYCLGRVEGYALVAVEIVGILLLHFVVVVLGLFVKLFGVFEVLAGFIGTVGCDVLLES